jgi:hypothetical protein
MTNEFVDRIAITTEGLVSVSSEAAGRRHHV